MLGLPSCKHKAALHGAALRQLSCVLFIMIIFVGSIATISCRLGWDAGGFTGHRRLGLLWLAVLDFVVRFGLNGQNQKELWRALLALSHAACFLLPLAVDLSESKIDEAVRFGTWLLLKARTDWLLTFCQNWANVVSFTFPLLAVCLCWAWLGVPQLLRRSVGHGLAEGKVVAVVCVASQPHCSSFRGALSWFLIVPKL